MISFKYKAYFDGLGADNGEDYLMPSVLRAVLAWHIPQRLDSHQILILGIPRNLLSVHIVENENIENYRLQP